MTKKPVIEIHTSDGGSVKYRVIDPEPCPNCGAIPEIFCDKDNLTVVIYCANCKIATGFSVFGKAIDNWNQYRHLLYRTKKTKEETQSDKTV